MPQVFFLGVHTLDEMVIFIRILVHRIMWNMMMMVMMMWASHSFVSMIVDIHVVLIAVRNHMPVVSVVVDLLVW